MDQWDLKDKVVVIAGIGDDAGFAWAIAKAFKNLGAKVIAGTWPPLLGILEQILANEKYSESRKLKNGQELVFDAIYPLDALYDTLDAVPQDVKENKRYKGLDDFSIKGFVSRVAQDFGKVDIMIHAIANAKEIKNPLSMTSREGYLHALSASSYSFVSLCSCFKTIMGSNGSCLTLTYRAADQVIPGYGGGMSSAKAALEADVRYLAYELGQEKMIRVNAISAGPLASRAARAIGMIDSMIEYSFNNSPIQRDLEAEDVANTMLFLASPLSKAITGQVIYVDHGLGIMGRPTQNAEKKEEALI
ncbi:MAG: enoyl-[acyl-carrier-protein] reductase [Chlamydiae bacterium]|nr:enoyl-[acyl-carrier-protein] reductase [Chlamydiota bacterium]